MHQEATHLAALAAGNITIKLTDWVGGYAVLGAARALAGYVPDLSLAVVPDTKCEAALDLTQAWLLDHMCNPRPRALTDLTAEWRDQWDL